MKKYTLFVGLVIIISLISVLSCSKIDSKDPVPSESSTEETVFSQSNAILSFESDEAFMNAVNEIRNGKEDIDAVTKSSRVENFISLYDEFKQAMAEADYYYQKEGGYEKFKARFPNLYYPEHNEDYAAFLPVSDEAIAKLINQKGKVNIAKKEVDFRDVFSYDKILELGLGMPEETMSEIVSTKSLNETKILTLNQQTINNKRKAWITLRGIAINDIQFQGKVGRVDLCFRKKGILGWYNGQLTSESYVITGYAPAPSTEVYTADYIGGAKTLEYSPHKYVVAIRPLTATTSNFGTRTFYFRFGLEDLTYSFTGEFTTNVDALLAKNNGTGIGEDLASAFTFRGVIEETFGNNYPYNWYVFGYSN